MAENILLACRPGRFRHCRPGPHSITNGKPLERRWILPPTMLVVALLGMVGVHSGITGLLPVSRAVTSATASLIVISVMAYGYSNSRELVTD